MASLETKNRIDTLNREAQEIQRSLLVLADAASNTGAAFFGQLQEQQRTIWRQVDRLRAGTANH